MSSRHFSYFPTLIAVSLLSMGLTSCEKAKDVFGQIKEKINPSESSVETSEADSTPTKAMSFAGGTVHEISEKDFDATVNDPNRLVVVDFTATWCPPCKILGPMLVTVASEFPETALFVKVDVDKNPKLTQRMRVRGIPDVRLYRKGKQVDQFVGAIPLAEIRQLVKAKAPASLPAPEKKPEAVAETPKPSKPSGPPIMAKVDKLKTEVKKTAPPEDSFFDKIKEKTGFAKPKPTEPVDKDGKPIVPPIREVVPGEEWLPAGMGKGKAPPESEPVAAGKDS